MSAICTKCGTGNRNGSKFCKKCAAKLSGEAASTGSSGFKAKVKSILLNSNEGLEAGSSIRIAIILISAFISAWTLAFRKDPLGIFFAAIALIWMPLIANRIFKSKRPFVPTAAKVWFSLLLLGLLGALLDGGFIIIACAVLVLVVSAAILRMKDG